MAEDKATPVQAAYTDRKKKARTLAVCTSSLVRAWRNREPVTRQLKRLSRAWASYKSACAKEDALFNEAKGKMQSR